MQSLSDLLAALSTLTALELKYEEVPGYAVPTLSELEPLHERVFDLLGSSPTRHRRPASCQSMQAVRRPRCQPSHQRPVRNAAIWHAGARGRDLTKSIKQLINRELHQFKTVTHVGVQP